ncbi:hypothetical protein Tco_1447898 [Tanacetum coccineum]
MWNPLSNTKKPLSDIRILFPNSRNWADCVQELKVLVIVFMKSVFRISLEGDEILRVQGERTQGVMKTLLNTKVDEPKTTDRVVLIKEKFKAVRDHQRSYAGNRRKLAPRDGGDSCSLDASFAYSCDAAICTLVGGSNIISVADCREALGNHKLRDRNWKLRFEHSGDIEELQTKFRGSPAGIMACLVVLYCGLASKKDTWEGIHGRAQGVSTQ